MKTINQIKKEEKDLRSEAHYADYTRKKQIKRRLELLKTCRIYLETEPSEQYLRDELHRVSKKIEIIQERFPAWSAGKIGGGTELQRRYDALTDKSKLRFQVRTLQYLLI